jgi:APA family basic amino acid/polyamine antiporter
LSIANDPVYILHEGDVIKKQLTSTHESGTLVRQLGLGDSISLVMGIMIGSGIFLMAGSIAREVDSIAVVIAVWTLGGILSIAGALSLSELGAAFPAAGGLYVYMVEAYGPVAGFVYGWSAVTLIHAGSIATMAAAVGFYSAPLLGLSYHQQKLLQVLSIVGFTAVNCFGLSMGKRIQNTLTAIKVMGIVLIIVVLYAKGSAAMLRGNLLLGGSSHTRLSSFGLALIAVLWAYDGWHFVSFTAGEIRNPSRTLPRSLLLGTLLTTAIYLLLNVAYYAVLTPASIRGTDRVAAIAIQHVFGPRAAVFMSILIVVSILGAMNGVILGAPRVNFAMARDGLFFRQFGSLNRRTHAPVVATVAQGAWAILFTLIGSFQQLFTSYVFTSWIFYGLCVAGLIVLRRRRPELNRPYRCPLYPITPIFFVAASIGIVATTFVSNFRQATLGVGLMLLGLPFYALFRFMERGRTPAHSHSAKE